MATNNSVNLKVTNNADGFDVAGGTTARKLTTTGADVTLTGSGTNVYKFPTASTYLGSTARGIIATDFETTGRFTQNASSGTATFGTTGVSLDTTVTTSRFIRLRGVAPVANFKAFSGSPSFYAGFSMTTVGTTGSYYIGIGAVTAATSGHTMTDAHIGFKITVAASVASLYATQADGTENASSALVTLVAGDWVEVWCVVNGTTSVDYYWSQNQGAISSATNLTSNLPTSTSDTWLQSSVSNNTTATQQTFVMNAASFTRGL